MRWRASRGTSWLALATAIVVASILAVNAPVGQAASAAAIPRLVGIRAAHRPRVDRVVFQFTGPVPAQRTVRYVDGLIGNPSGRRIPIAGRAILKVTFSPATAHDVNGNVTTPRRIAFALPNVLTVVSAGDFETVLSYGIGLAKRARTHVFTLSRPSRVVIDVPAAFRTVPERVFFVDQRRFAANTDPFVTGVLRPVLPAAPATGVMDRLFAGPTAGEHAVGLGLLESRATGFAGLSIAAGTASVRLTGGCSSGGSTVSIADEIVPTLRQLPTVEVRQDL